MQTPAEAYASLSPKLQRFIHQRGWSELNALQTAAAEPILKHDGDIVLSAATASGKTEAAFLPAITYIEQHPAPGFRILYVSPLKALINDQTRRLEDMCFDLNLKITPWHGDVSANRKEKQLRSPEGIVLITPESLESLLLNHYTMLKTALSHLEYIVIDEFHAFMGTQRGVQLISQLHRLDNLAGRRIVRIALSATFSNISSIQRYLRPNAPHYPCQMIAPDMNKQDSLAIQLRGFTIRPEGTIPAGYEQAAADIFRLLRGGNHLVFTNSRAKTEFIAGCLSSLCQQAHVPQEFFPHHGSLSKELRESLELRLQQGRLPTTAICTSTLELGIDIADVQSIGQIDAPLSVASLRQRLGRSGRRNRQAILRLFVPEQTEDSPDLSAQLCEETFLSIAMVELLLKRWYEPPLASEYSFSVLLQQTLSVIASVGSASAANLWNLLCRSGPFYLIDQKIFANFLRSLAAHDLIVQLGDGTLALGLKGEELCSDWSFYSVFKTADDFVIEHDHREIGRIPLTTIPEKGECFVFAGKAWEVHFVSVERRILGVKPSDRLASPLNGNSGLGQICDEACKRMKMLYQQPQCPPYLNQQAREHFARGAAFFAHYDLAHQLFIEVPAGIALFPFQGSRAQFTLALLLRRELVHAQLKGRHILVEYCSRDNLKSAVRRLIDKPPQNAHELIGKIVHLEENKYDEFISRPLQELAFAHSHLDLAGAYGFLKQLSTCL